MRWARGFALAGTSLLAGAIALVLSVPAGAERGAVVAPDPPRRVVSMNLCTDQLAMLIAAPGQLVSVSYLAQQPRSSAMPEEARAHRANRGLAEEIFLLEPDLVIAGSFTTRATVSLLRRLGIPVAEFAPADSLDDIRDRLAQMGRVLGREVVAGRLVGRFDADLASARVAATRLAAAERPRAATYSANSYTSGSRTLAGSVLDAAGLANIAIELGLEGGSRLALERLVMEAPDLVVTGREFETPALAQEVLTHPALAALRARAGSAPVADRDWVCGTPFVIAAVQRLATARDALLAAD